MKNTLIAVHVTPRAGRDEVWGVRVAEQGGGGAPWVGDAREVCVRVAAPPDGGKANKAVCKLVASALGIPKSAVEVVSGQTSRHKRLSVACDSEKVESWIGGIPALK